MQYLKIILTSSFLASVLIFGSLPAQAQLPQGNCDAAGNCIDTTGSSTPISSTKKAGSSKNCDAVGNCIDTSTSSSPASTSSKTSCTNQCADNSQGLCIPNPLTDCTISGLLSRIIDWLIYLSFFITVVMIIWGGVNYVTAGGNAEKVKTANRTLVYALIGFAIVILSKAFASLLVSLLAGKSFSLF